MKILLTGFEGFQGHDRNPSWEMLQHIPDSYGDVEIVKAQIPVEWEGTKTAFEAAVRREKPDVVLSYGLSGMLSSLKCEEYAWNYQMGVDNRHVRKNGIADPNSRVGVHASITPQQSMGWLKSGPMSAVASIDAGSYLCEYVLYLAGCLAAEDGLDFDFAFTHVPARDDDPQFGSTYKKAPFADMQRAAELMVEGAAVDILGAEKLPNWPGESAGEAPTETHEEPPEEHEETPPPAELKLSPVSVTDFAISAVATGVQGEEVVFLLNGEHRFTRPAQDGKARFEITFEEARREGYIHDGAGNTLEVQAGGATARGEFEVMAAPAESDEGVNDTPVSPEPEPVGEKPAPPVVDVSGDRLTITVNGIKADQVTFVVNEKFRGNEKIIFGRAKITRNISRDLASGWLHKGENTALVEVGGVASDPVRFMVGSEPPADTAGPVTVEVTGSYGMYTWTPTVSDLFTIEGPELVVNKPLKLNRDVRDSLSGKRYRAGETITGGRLIPSVDGTYTVSPA